MSHRWFGLLMLSISVLFGICLLWLESNVRRSRSSPLVLIVSIDAFRYDFISRPESKMLRKLAQRSTFGPMLPQFPSFTFTNHYSLMTGLHPIHHGIVANRFYDAELDQVFHIKDRSIMNDKHWWLAEPLWITANKKGLHTATLFWPSDEVWTHTSHKYIPYNKTLTYEERLEQLFEWIDEDPELSMATLYFSLVDDIGHKFGPDSIEMDVALERLDTYIRQLLRGLEARGLMDSINLIILSDHGLIQAANGESNIYIDTIIPALHEKIIWMDYNAVTTVFPLPGEEQYVFELLYNAVEDYNLPMNVMWTEELPSHYHFRQSSRIGSITVITEPGYTLAKTNGIVYGGFHGYDPSLRGMHSIFLATGPDLNIVGELKNPTSSLDVYPLLARLLKIEPNPNNGTTALAELVLGS